MTLQEFNQLESKQALKSLTTCCGSSSWAGTMNDRRPFKSLADMIHVAETAWEKCSETDWLEAFEHHPMIGDIKTLKERFRTTRVWAEKEQSGVYEAEDAVIEKLALLNKLYLDKFGFIFIVFASGKTAGEMLEILKTRIQNSKTLEIREAAKEQMKITKLRIHKLIEG